MFTNTGSVLVADELAAAMGDRPNVIAVLLRARDRTLRVRLDDRALGRASDRDLIHSAESAVELDCKSSKAVHRIDTDALSPDEVAAILDDITGWTGMAAASEIQ